MDETNSKDGLTYSDRKVQINPGHPLYEWCSTVTSLSNNLYNASLFHIRQCMTGLKKTEEQRQDLEKEVIEKIDAALPLMNETKVKAWQKKKAKYDALDKEARKEKQKPKLSLFKAPTAKNWMLSYNFLDGMFKVTQNPDYFARGLPRHTAQSIIKQACQDMKSFFEASKAYKKDPGAFLGKPKLPHYKKKGGQCTAFLSNQECKYDPKKRSCKLPLTKTRLKIGEAEGCLKQVKVCPAHGVFVIHLVFEQKIKETEIPETIKTAALDPGLENFASIVTSSGSKGLIVKGGAIRNAKRQEQYKAQRFQSGQCGRTKKKFIPTKRYRKCTLHYENQVRDLVSKTAVQIIRYLKENEIDTLIVGHNKNQKQNIDIGTKNNRQFCSMPIEILRNQLKYRCQKEGIQYLETEESYTSKASFLDQDILPEYEEGKHYAFSGKRTSRGKYRSKDGIVINADLNGAANIGRKLFPELFDAKNVSFEADVWRITART